MISIVLPAKNEAAALKALLPRLRAAQPDADILVVDDGSTDETAQVCAQADVRSVKQPYSMGNGAVGSFFGADPLSAIARVLADQFGALRVGLANALLRHRSNRWPTYSDCLV